MGELTREQQKEIMIKEIEGMRAGVNTTCDYLIKKINKLISDDKWTKQDLNWEK